jgi:hypothetical protein
MNRNHVHFSGVSIYLLAQGYETWKSMMEIIKKK